jgi:hypothetical protein
VKGTEHSTTKGPDVARWFLHYVYDSKERSGVVIDFAVDAYICIQSCDWNETEVSLGFLVCIFEFGLRSLNHGESARLRKGLTITEVHKQNVDTTFIPPLERSINIISLFLSLNQLHLYQCENQKSSKYTPRD